MWKTFLAALIAYTRILDRSVCYLSAWNLAQRYNLNQNVAISTGIGRTDYDKTLQILELVPQLKCVCMDVANGYMDKLLSFVTDISIRLPNHTIMVAEFYFLLLLCGTTFH